jgi:hypothetical protein
VSYYGSAQVGHLYFFGSALQTPQRGSVMLFASQLNLDLVLYRRRAFGDAIGLERSLVKEFEDDAQPVAITSRRSAFPQSQRG